MDHSARAFVRKRARNRCEYCGLHQEQEHHYAFHVEHIVARQHGGTDDAANLALACHHCNLHKGPNLTGVDPETGVLTRLFNPRTQVWADHFALVSVEVRGLTPVGRATVSVLSMNAAPRMELRGELD